MVKGRLKLIISVLKSCKYRTLTEVVSGRAYRPQGRRLCGHRGLMPHEPLSWSPRIYRELPAQELAKLSRPREIGVLELQRLTINSRTRNPHLVHLRVETLPAYCLRCD